MNDLKQILVDPNKKFHEARGLLAKLYRKILADIKMSPLVMEQRLNDWVDNPKNNVPRNGKSRSTFRGNAMKEISRADMTFKVFLKGLMLLKPKAIKFSIELEWPDRRISHHFFNLRVEDINLDDEQGDVDDRLETVLKNPNEE